MTSSLFATTALASFFVVALPHILPCPAPRVAYAEGEIIEDQNGRRRRRRRPQAQDMEAKDGVIEFNSIVQDDIVKKDGKRECPVPKPGGIVGELFGFRKPSSEVTKSNNTS